jgi:hypothetical protein
MAGALPPPVPCVATPHLHAARPCHSARSSALHARHVVPAARPLGGGGGGGGPATSMLSGCLVHAGARGPPFSWFMVAGPRDGGRQDECALEEGTLAGDPPIVSEGGGGILVSWAALSGRGCGFTERSCGRWESVGLAFQTTRMLRTKPQSAVPGPSSPQFLAPSPQASILQTSASCPTTPPIVDNLARPSSPAQAS